MNIVYPQGWGTEPLEKLKFFPRRLKFLTVGGAPPAFIADHHVPALQTMGYLVKIVASAPSRNGDKALLYGTTLGIPTFTSWKEMFQTYGNKSPEERPDAVVILTDTGSHADIAVEAFGHGFHVVSDKPPAVDLTEMLAIERAATEAGKLFFATYNHNLYAANIHASRLVQTNQIGKPHTIRVQFLQSWGLGDAINWRFETERCCGNDLASHCERLVAFYLGDDYKLVGVSGRCRILKPGRVGDDHVTARLEYHSKNADNTVIVNLEAGEMFAGHEDDFSIGIYGTRGSIRWSHLIPYQLTVSDGGREMRMVDGRDFKNPASFCPPEHPTGFADSWRATYMGILGRLAVSAGFMSFEELPPELTLPVCDLRGALASMSFLEALYESSDTGSPTDL